MDTPITTITFGNEGDAASYQADGWSIAEPGYVWTMGDRAALVIPRPPVGDYYLRIDWHVFRHENRPYQRVCIRLGDAVLARYVAIDSGVQDVWIPAAAIETAPDPMHLSFELPDASCPAAFGWGADTRTLALSFRRLDLIALSSSVPANDMQKISWVIESVGANCEVGLVQRRAGAEPLGLLRFAASRMDSLLAALESDFAGLGEATNIKLAIHGVAGDAQWMVFDQCYGFEFHTFANPEKVSGEAIIARETKRLPWLARKLLDDLAAGDKLFVYQGDEMTDLRAATHLAGLIRRRGPSTLLSVFTDPMKAGEVWRAGDNLLIGYVSKLTPPTSAIHFVWDDWAHVLPAAHAVWRDHSDTSVLLLK